MKKIILQVIAPFRHIFKAEETQFIVITGLKVSLISFAISSVVSLWLYELMRLNYLYFANQGLSDVFGEAGFYSYISKELVDNLPVFFLYHMCLFFIGCYVGWIVLRPFRTLADYSEKVIENPNHIYKVDEFSTYKLLTRFSEFFFEYLRESRRKGELNSNSIPPQFAKIHKPVFDQIFMLHFGLLMIIISVSNGLFIIENAYGVFENLEKLASKTIYTKFSENFITNQSFILDDITLVTLSLIAISYFALGMHVYDKVSGAAFGIFSTMRSFMKGNYSSRVHLLGFAHVREYTRKFNKYLDYIQNNYKKN